MKLARVASRSLGVLLVVLGGTGGVGAARRRGPVHGAGLGLVEVPAGGVLGVVVAGTGRGEVVLAGGAVGVGDGVVDVAGGGLGAAAGGGAGAGAGADEVPEDAAGYADPRFRMTFARLCAHYFSHAAWLEDGQLLREAYRLAGIPGVLIHGRFDLGGPPDVAWLLHQAWPGSELHWVRTGHTGGDEMTDRTLSALNRFALGGRG